jgi:glycosyltransferase involved in cell wall biosynthesis
MKPPKVSVIVPIFNVEKYIQRCAVSLFEQTLDDVEYIFVNDCTPDKSLNVLQDVINEYPTRRNYIKIVNHEVNKGLATARNSGFAQATGDYVLNVDSDDWCDTKMLELLYAQAIEHESDIVWCDFYYASPDGTVGKCTQRTVEEPKILSKAIVTGKIHGFVWNKLIRRKLYLEHGISSKDGINICEDYNLTAKLTFCADKVSYCPKCLYYYFQRNDSLMGCIDRSRILKMVGDRRIAHEDVLAFLGSDSIVDDYLKEYGICFWNKPYLYLKDRGLQKQWKRSCSISIYRILKNPYIRRIDKLNYITLKLNVNFLYKLYLSWR